METHKAGLYCDMLSGRRAPHPVIKSMKIAGFLLLLAGWLLILSALVLLGGGGAQEAFVLAGLGVELLGLVLFVRAHLTPKEARH